MPLGRRLEDGLDRGHRAHRRAARVAAAGVGVHPVFHATRPVTDFASAKRADTARFGRFFHELLDRGVYLPPAQLEAGFISAAHTENDIDAFIAAADPAMKASIGPRQ